MEQVSEKTLKQREISKRYRERHADKERERQRKSKENKREADRDSYNAYAREWRNKNKDRINAERRERLKNDPEYAERMRLKGRERHKRNPDKSRRGNLKANYGITLEEYENLYNKQDGKCLICEQSFPNRGKNGLVVDHCHNEGHIRGLLCAKCNKGIGQFDDDIQKLHNAIKYLTRR